jgi:hypothetical protein
LDSHYTRSTILEEDKSIKSDSDGRVDGWGAYHKPTRGPAAHEGTLYIVAGSAGQVSGGSLLHPTMYAGLNVHGSLLLDVHGPKLEGRFIDTNALVRDYFTVTKGQPLASREPLKEVIDLAGEKIPARLHSLFEAKTSLVAVTNATPEDQDLLTKIYDEGTNVDKTALTWAMAWTGDAEIAVRLMGFLTNKMERGEWPQAEENLRVQTIQALGFLATRYEAVYLLLKRGIEPDFWQESRLGTPKRSDDAARELSLACIRALGLSGRPEAQLALLALRERGDKTNREWARNRRLTVERALVQCARFQKLGPVDFQKTVLRESSAGAQITSTAGEGSVESRRLIKQ